MYLKLSQFFLLSFVDIIMLSITTLIYALDEFLKSCL